MSLVLSLMQSAIFMLVVFLYWPSFPVEAGVAPLLFMLLGIKLALDMGVLALYYFIARRGGVYSIVQIIGVDILSVFLFAFMVSALTGTLLPSLFGIELDLGIKWAEIDHSMAALLFGAASIMSIAMLRVNRPRRED